MASSIPTFQTLISVNQFRELVNQHLKKQIKEGQKYDPRDLQRFNEIDEYTLMFIQHGQYNSSFDDDRALRIFNKTMSWRKENNIYDISTNEFPVSYFDRHAIYFKNHDMYNNPLLHFVVRIFDKNQEDSGIAQRFIIYNFERHIRRHPGQKIVILFDLNDTGLKHLDYDLVKFTIVCAQYYYPGLLAYMLIYKMPAILSSTCRTIRGWLPTEAEQFIKFVDGKSITQFVPIDQLSTTMGGTDTTNYTYVHDAINDAVEDPMNASLKKKVTFADTNSLDLPLSTSPKELQTSIENIPKSDSSPNDDILTTPEEPSSSLSTSDLSQSITRKSILQKPGLTNGVNSDEKVYHGLAIRPHDEMIFERSDSSSNHTTDCIQTLTLTNVGGKILTFKIKTTSPDKFRVKPGCSLLHPGASATISVYLLKTYCTPTSNINKEKFLIIWTLIGQEMKQTQLVEFWKNVPISVLFEHRLKCTFSNKSTSVILTNQSIESTPSPVSPPPPPSPAHPPIIPVNSSDTSIIEMQKILKDSLALQKTTLIQNSNELKKIRFLLLIIFALLILILLWDIFKYFFSPSTLSVKHDL